jgi:hypothetical protein
MESLFSCVLSKNEKKYRQPPKEEKIMIQSMTKLYSTLLRGLIVIAMFSGHKTCGGPSEMAESSRESVRQGLVKLKGLAM